MNDPRPSSRPEPAASPPAQRPAPTAAAGKDEASKQAKGAGWDDDDEPWRHAPVAPRDESPAESLGRSVSEVVTGPLRDEDAAEARTKP
ncbi:MAG TPA: hypothetical protein VNS61_08080 [Caldimonas sp.]|nr:hypothetical protein [Caldimonas sp.]